MFGEKKFVQDICVATVFQYNNMGPLITRLFVVCSVAGLVLGQARMDLDDSLKFSSLERQSLGDYDLAR